MEWRVTEQGPRVVVEVWRKDDASGLYKAWLTNGAGRCLLGTLVPENGRLYLKRILSIDSLRRQGVWPVRQVEEELVYSFRKTAGSPVAWEDEVLRQSAKNLPRHTVRRENDGFSLVFPFEPRAPFPLVPAFCFARVENGRLIFSFRKGGIPYIFQRQGKDKGDTEEQRRDPYGKPDHQGTERAGGSAGL